MADPTVRYVLTEAQLRALTVHHRPALDARGRTILVPNPGRAPYRFSDGSPGAPLGMTVYVGGRGARYEVRTSVKGKKVRIPVGLVNEVSLKQAHNEAAAYRHTAAVTSENPRKLLQAESATQEARGITVGDALRSYIKFLEHKVVNENGKPTGVDGARDSLARLSREDVGLANIPIADCTDAIVREAWVKLRVSAMSRSNRLPEDVRDQLVAYREPKSGCGWWALTRDQLHDKLGLEGRHVALAFAAGLASAEHTMGDAARAVQRVLDAERGAAANAGRPLAISYNPFAVLRSDGYYRSTRQLRRHYEAAKVRNPLGVDDDMKGTKSLPTVLKAIVARRDMQGGHNAAGVDYLLLTLLWGTRKSEGAQLRWYDSCSQDDLEAIPPRLSWVWLAPTPKARNPTTTMMGSQVFLHDTKNGDSLLIPVAYFAARVLAWRAATRAADRKVLTAHLKAAEDKLSTARIGTAARTEAFKEKERAQWRLEQVERWVFPARNPKAKAGHYTDSKSIIDNVRADADLQVGLTTHDFRRTMGRIAAKLLPGNIVSQLLHHTKDKDPEKGAKVSDRYTVAEWSTLRDAMEKVDEALIATSPRVWNILKGPDRPRLDEVNDPEVVVPTWRGHGRKTKQSRSKAVAQPAPKRRGRKVAADD